MTVSMHMTQAVDGIKTFFIDLTEGILEVTHNGLVFFGAAAVAALLVLTLNPQLRQQGEVQLTNWLTARQTAITGLEVEPQAVQRATATNPRNLSREQANLTRWISDKYRVAPEPIAVLVEEAYKAGQINNLDPALILAVMAIESSFNPFAQSHAGAQGLMQVVTEIHSDKYTHFGGNYAAFDPRSNLRVGVRILHEYISRTGSVRGGLKWYVGAANLKSDGGYAAKVLAEYKRMYQATHGSPLPREQELRAAYNGPQLDETEAQDTTPTARTLKLARWLP